MRIMNNIWKSAKYSVKTKLRLYNACVLSTLLYGSECWRMTKCDAKKLSTFHTTCLRKILRIFWPNKISNENLLERCNTEDLETLITRRRWQWIGHVLRMDRDSITKTSLHWTPEGKRKQGRPKETWRRTVNAEIKKMNKSWSALQRLACDRERWRGFVAALRVTGHTGT